MDKETLLAYLKIALLWAVSGWNWAVKALPVVAMLLTITFTALQLYVLWRDKLRGSNGQPVAEDDLDLMRPPRHDDDL